MLFLYLIHLYLRINQSVTPQCEFNNIKTECIQVCEKSNELNKEKNNDKLEDGKLNEQKNKNVDTLLLYTKLIKPVVTILRKYKDFKPTFVSDIQKINTTREHDKENTVNSNVNIITTKNAMINTSIPQLNKISSYCSEISNNLGEALSHNFTTITDLSNLSTSLNFKVDPIYVMSYKLGENSLEKDFSILAKKENEKSFYEQFKSKNDVKLGEAMPQIMSKKISQYKNLSLNTETALNCSMKNFNGNVLELYQNTNKNIQTASKKQKVTKYFTKTLYTNKPSRHRTPHSECYAGISFSKLYTSTVVTPYITSFTTEYPSVSFIYQTTSIAISDNELPTKTYTSNILENMKIQQECIVNDTKCITGGINNNQNIEEGFINSTFFNALNTASCKKDKITSKFEDKYDNKYTISTIYSTYTPYITRIFTEYPETSYKTVTESYTETPLQTLFEIVYMDNKINTSFVTETVTINEQKNSEDENLNSKMLNNISAFDTKQQPTFKIANDINIICVKDNSNECNNSQKSTLLPSTQTDTKIYNVIDSKSNELQSTTTNDTTKTTIYKTVSWLSDISQETNNTKIIDVSNKYETNTNENMIDTETIKDKQIDGTSTHSNFITETIKKNILIDQSISSISESIKNQILSSISDKQKEVDEKSRSKLSFESSLISSVSLSASKVFASINSNNIDNFKSVYANQVKNIKNRNVDTSILAQLSKPGENDAHQDSSDKATKFDSKENILSQIEIFITDMMEKLTKTNNKKRKKESKQLKNKEELQSFTTVFITETVTNTKKVHDKYESATNNTTISDDKDIDLIINKEKMSTQGDIKDYKKLESNKSTNDRKEEEISTQNVKNIDDLLNLQSIESKNEEHTKKDTEYEHESYKTTMIKQKNISSKNATSETTETNMKTIISEINFENNAYMTNTLSKNVNIREASYLTSIISLQNEDSTYSKNEENTTDNEEKNNVNITENIDMRDYANIKNYKSKTDDINKISTEDVLQKIKKQDINNQENKHKIDSFTSNFKNTNTAIDVIEKQDEPTIVTSICTTKVKHQSLVSDSKNIDTQDNDSKNTISNDKIETNGLDITEKNENKLKYDSKNKQKISSNQQNDKSFFEKLIDKGYDLFHDSNEAETTTNFNFVYSTKSSADSEEKHKTETNENIVSFEETKEQMSKLSQKMVDFYEMLSKKMDTIETLNEEVYLSSQMSKIVDMFISKLTEKNDNITKLDGSNNKRNLLISPTISPLSIKTSKNQITKSTISCKTFEKKSYKTDKTISKSALPLIDRIINNLGLGEETKEHNIDTKSRKVVKTHTIYDLQPSNKKEHTSKKHKKTVTHTFYKYGNEDKNEKIISDISDKIV